MNLEEFKSLYGSMLDENLAIKFGISVMEVDRLATEHRLGKDKRLFMGGRMPRWSEEEEEMLRTHFATTSSIWLAKKLRRSVKSITSKAHIMHLRKDIERIVEMGRENVAKRRDRK